AYGLCANCLQAHACRVLGAAARRRCAQIPLFQESDAGCIAYIFTQFVCELPAGACLPRTGSGGTPPRRRLSLTIQPDGIGCGGTPLNIWDLFYI
ncbi:MAG: hypothetical protein IIY78_01050, partial [Clostridia bacterium]|nr:hypothetical protein [Clostridia bacterium]